MCALQATVRCAAMIPRAPARDGASAKMLLANCFSRAAWVPARPPSCPLLSSPLSVAESGQVSATGGGRAGGGRSSGRAPADGRRVGGWAVGTSAGGPASGRQAGALADCGRSVGRGAGGRAGRMVRNKRGGAGGVGGVGGRTASNGRGGRTARGQAAVGLAGGSEGSRGARKTGVWRPKASQVRPRSGQFRRVRLGRRRQWQLLGQRRFGGSAPPHAR